MIKRQVPEGKNYIIVIPSNVEYVIRKFCAKAPDNEWSGTLFYDVEGDFDSETFKIICRDFLLMDLGSAAFTEFDEDGTAIDYIAQHPELLDCQMGLLHSHDKMSTFFSGTDTNTLNKEGNDRNNFVSLIVNNAGVYSAGITRKVDYKEVHSIDISGEYPFFGTREMKTVEPVHTNEEKVKRVIEWFEMTIEKATVEFSEDEYDAGFREIASRKTTVHTYKSPYYGGGYSGYMGRSPELFPASDDEEEVFVNPAYSRVVKLPGKEEKKEENKGGEIMKKTDFAIFGDSFDQETLTIARSIPSYPYAIRKLILSVITGCPVIFKIWTKDTSNKSFLEIFQMFKDSGYTDRIYEAFVSDTVEREFCDIELNDFFPDHIVKDDNMTDSELENILIIKMIDILAEVEAHPLCEGAIEALKDFYSV